MSNCQMIIIDTKPWFTRCPRFVKSKIYIFSMPLKLLTPILFQEWVLTMQAAAAGRASLSTTLTLVTPTPRMTMVWGPCPRTGRRPTQTRGSPTSSTITQVSWPGGGFIKASRFDFLVSPDKKWSNVFSITFFLCFCFIDLLIKDTPPEAPLSNFKLNMKVKLKTFDIPLDIIALRESVFDG